ncbi:MAG: hypothetical protein JWO49_2859, partial [Arthrobacter sp.]|nr:hypothetical protein [Arthrobacter sp.]
MVNNFSVVLADPGEILRGTLSLATTLHSPGPGKYTVRVEYSPAGAENWKTACTSPGSPYTCTWNTATLTGDYDL